MPAIITLVAALRHFLFTTPLSPNDWTNWARERLPVWDRMDPGDSWNCFNPGKKLDRGKLCVEVFYVYYRDSWLIILVFCLY